MSLETYFFLGLRRTSGDGGDTRETNSSKYRLCLLNIHGGVRQEVVSVRHYTEWRTSSVRYSGATWRQTSEKFQQIDERTVSDSEQEEKAALSEVLKT